MLKFPDILGSLERALHFLMASQNMDGSFVDYYLPVGGSDGWITGFTAVSIGEAVIAFPVSGSKDIIKKAARFLLTKQRPMGWGYNSFAAEDGDSTAFAVRAILRAGCYIKDAEGLLREYIDEKGYGHTFVNRDNMGNWTGRHADITASIGIALKEVNADFGLRKEVLAAGKRAQQGLWHGYWWKQPCYATWLNLKWLRMENSLTQEHALSVLSALSRLSGDLSALDVASLLGILSETSHLTQEPVPEGIFRSLISLQRQDGSWPPSYSLVLPPQHERNGTDLQCFADHRSIFTTSLTIQILAAWVMDQAKESNS